MATGASAPHQHAIGTLQSQKKSQPAAGLALSRGGFHLRLPNVVYLGVQLSDTIFTDFTSRDGPLDADARGDAAGSAGVVALLSDFVPTAPVTSTVWPM